MSESTAALLSSVGAAYEKVNWAGKLVMSGLFLMVLLSGSGSVVVFFAVGSVAVETFPTQTVSEMFALLLDLVAIICGLRLIYVRNRHWNLEVVAVAAIIGSGFVLWCDATSKGTVTEDDALVFWSVAAAHSGLPLAYLAAMTALRRIPWQRRPLLISSMKNS